MPNTLPRSVRAEIAEDAGSNASANPTIGDLIAVRLSRRDLIGGALAATVAGAVGGPLALSAKPAYAVSSAGGSAFNFAEIAAGTDANHHVADGYRADVLVRWGDPVLVDAPGFDPKDFSADAQSRQFGYNNDFIGFLPIDGRSDHGLLVVNHEYVNPELMFPGIGYSRDGTFENITPAHVACEMMAHGGSIIEVLRENGTWGVVANSKFARRITAQTPMRISGPASGHELMKTSADATGAQVLGMLNNCAGGVTPWGTWLTCEENFNGYFWGKGAAAPLTPEARALRRYGVPSEWYAWGQHHDRFNVEKEPNEPHRFGWVVEIDPFDPGSEPVKRTALGRFKHEGAGNIINSDGRFVVYQGDDERFEYVYKFVTRDRINLTDRAANGHVLDHGTLFVARFDADGTGTWLPLIQGEAHPWLNPKFGFRSQADVLIHARLAADLVGATKMDRPEDIDVNPVTGKVYLALTNNSKRTAEQTNTANPRAENKFGHVIEIVPDHGDHAATTFRWEILLKCGDPAVATVGAMFNPATTQNGWFGMPDNCAIDALGRLWIATDGNMPSRTGRSDGLWAIDTEGAARGMSQHFYRVPSGAELCGPCFTPDMETLFVSVQHPGEHDKDDPAAQPSVFDNPTTRWPDFDADVPPRPSVVVITKKGGGKIGV